MECTSIVITDDGAERRAAERHGSAIQAEVHQCDWQPYRLMISEISLRGCRINGLKGAVIGQQIEVAMADLGVVLARVVRRSGLKQHAIEFITPLSQTSLEALLASEKKWAFVGRSPDTPARARPVTLMGTFSRLLVPGPRAA